MDVPPLEADAPFSAALRAAVAADGGTAYAIAKRAGVGINVLTRWLAGERDLRLASADKLAAALGVRCLSTQPSAKTNDGKKGSRRLSDSM